MITFCSGDIFESHAEALVNPVNCVGVAGVGLAKEFRKRCPDNFAAYLHHCSHGVLKIGTCSFCKCALYDHDGNYVRDVTVINFPTKHYWKQKSSAGGIKAGLSDLRSVVLSLDLKSIAIPALGCGLGGLKWDLVYSLIVDAFSYPDMDTVEVYVYEP